MELLILANMNISTVMNCQYDIKGFYPLNYENIGEDAMMF